MAGISASHAARRHGKNWYVATAGGGGSNSNNGLTTATPFLTIAFADAAAAAGDNIVLRAGTYSHSADLVLTANGTAAKRITIQNYGGETAIIAGAGTSSGGHDFYVGGYGSAGTQGNYRTFLGVEISAWNHGFYVCGHHCIVNDVYAHDFWNNGLFFDGDTTASNASTDNLVINSHIYNVCFINSPAGAGANGQGISFKRADRSVAINNFVERCWGEAIGCIECVTMTIQNNIVSDAWDVYLYNDSSQAVTWDGNLCYASGLNSGRGAGVGSDGMVFAQELTARGIEMDGCVVKNNIMINLSNGIYFYIYSATGHSPRNTTIVNNTITNAVSSSLRWATDTGGGSANIFRNNILYHTSAGTNQTGADASTFTHDHNNWYNGVGGSWTGTGDVTSNPTLVAPATLTAAAQKPQAGSPVLAAGSATAAPPVDYGGVTRSSPPSIGAWETS